MSREKGQFKLIYDHFSSACVIISQGKAKYANDKFLAIFKDDIDDSEEIIQSRYRVKNNFCFSRRRAKVSESKSSFFDFKLFSEFNKENAAVDGRLYSFNKVLEERE